MTLITGKRGFTLIELLVVTGIIIVIAAFILTAIPGLRERTQNKATKAFIDRLELATEQYYDDNRSYPPVGTEPTPIEDLKTALQPSDTTARRYIEFDDSETSNNVIVDYWGNPMVYRYPGIQNTDSYDLYSTGPDGVTSSTENAKGTEADDINNWSR